MCMSEFVTATKKTRAHYREPGIMETVLRVSESNGCYRWANGDNNDWYWARDKARKMDETNYKALTSKHRTLYSTLSLFHENVFDVRFSEFENDKLRKSCQYVNGYTFGIDIDTVDEINGHGVNIEEPEVKKAVEAAAQYFCDRLRMSAPKSVYCLFSGGGIYVMLHHGMLAPFFDKIAFCSSPEDYVRFVRALTDALNVFTKKLSDEFFELHPAYKNLVKIDHINGAKRIFKTIFSIHKRHDFAVIPLSPLNVKICFEKAKLPLAPEVIIEGKRWYIESDNTVEFLKEIKPFLEIAIDRIKKDEITRKVYQTDFKISENMHEFEEYPPCVRHILTLETCGVGASRALIFLATFLGHIEPDEEKAYRIWLDVAKRWKSPAAENNVWRSHYRVMHCASCATLNTHKGGFPHVDITEVGACKPDLRCQQIECSNPIYYTDNKMYIEKLKADLLKD